MAISAVPAIFSTFFSIIQYFSTRQFCDGDLFGDAEPMVGTTPEVWFDDHGLQVATHVGGSAGPGRHGKHTERWSRVDNKCGSPGRSKTAEKLENASCSVSGKVVLCVCLMCFFFFFRSFYRNLFLWRKPSMSFFGWNISELYSWVAC